MRFLHIAISVSALLVAHDASAQGSQLSVALGVEQSASRNPGASPYVYHGAGLAWALRFARGSDAAEWDLKLSGSRATLRSSVTQGMLPREVLTAGALGGSWQCRISSTDRLTWRGGVVADARIAHLRHDYTGTYASSDDFGFLVLGLGPTIGAELRARGGTFANRIALPVASWVDYPYSNAKAHGGSLRMSFATLNRLQSVEDELSYRRGQLTSRYRISYLRYAAGEPRVFANHSLSVELEFLKWGRR